MKKNRFISGLSALAVMAMPLTAYAANPITETTEQKGEAVITTEIAPSYIVTIPADTKVQFNSLETSFGNITLTEARLDPGKVVRVHLTTDFTLKNKADTGKTIPYDITTTDDAGTSGSLKKFDVQLEFKGDTCPLTIAITQDDWNKAYAGEYSDTVTFTISYEDAPAAEPEAEP